MPFRYEFTTKSQDLFKKQNILSLNSCIHWTKTFLSVKGLSFEKRDSASDWGSLTFSKATKTKIPKYHQNICGNHFVNTVESA